MLPGRAAGFHTHNHQTDIYVKVMSLQSTLDGAFGCNLLHIMEAWLLHDTMCWEGLSVGIQGLGMLLIPELKDGICGFAWSLPETTLIAYSPSFDTSSLQTLSALLNSSSQQGRWYGWHFQWGFHSREVVKCFWAWLALCWLLEAFSLLQSKPFKNKDFFQGMPGQSQLRGVQ